MIYKPGSIVKIYKYIVPKENFDKINLTYTGADFYSAINQDVLILEHCGKIWYKVLHKNFIGYTTIE